MCCMECVGPLELSYARMSVNVKRKVSALLQLGGVYINSARVENLVFPLKFQDVKFN